MVWSLKPSNTKRSFLTHIIFYYQCFKTRVGGISSQNFLLDSLCDLPVRSRRVDTMFIPFLSPHFSFPLSGFPRTESLLGPKNLLRNMPTTGPRILTDSNSVDLKWSPRVCISTAPKLALM